MFETTVTYRNLVLVGRRSCGSSCCSPHGFQPQEDLKLQVRRQCSRSWQCVPIGRHSPCRCPGRGFSRTVGKTSAHYLKAMSLLDMGPQVIFSSSQDTHLSENMLVITPKVDTLMRKNHHLRCKNDHFMGIPGPSPLSGPFLDGKRM